MGMGDVFLFSQDEACLAGGGGGLGEAFRHRLWGVGQTADKDAVSDCVNRSHFGVGFLEEPIFIQGNT